MKTELRSSLPALLAGFLAWLPGAASAGPLQAGVAIRTITPATPQFLAGLAENRRSAGIHDDLWVRALALSDGETTVVIASFDLIGLLRPQVEAIRAGVPELPPGNVILSCTHLHSGPDTIGLWGPTEMETGVDTAYLQFLQNQAIACLREALGTLHPVLMEVSETLAPPKTSWNANDEGLIDRRIGVIRFCTPQGNTLATLVNWACHPETLWSDNRLITSDFAGYLRGKVEAELGGICVFVNGALGGMITVDNRDAQGRNQHTFAEAQRIGEAVGLAAVQAFRQNPPLVVRLDQLHLRVATAHLALPVANEKLQGAIRAGVIPLPTPLEGTYPTDLTLVDLGPAQIVTVPGEALPAVGMTLKSLLPGPFRFLVGLSPDEVGYILCKIDYQNPEYAYEQSMSLGPQTAPLLVATVEELVRRMGQER